MKVLLTGAFGNIGSHTAPELARRGHLVRMLSLDTTERRGRGRGLPRGCEIAWGDVCDASDMARAVRGVDAVVHLAGVIPPAALEDPERARRTNVEGTREVLRACEALPTPPRLLFASTFDVHGRTLSKTPPRHVDDPVEATDVYTAHKIECEALVRASKLTWCIFRFTDVPILGIRDAHPIMFEIGLHNRIEALHADDAGLAVANALETPEVWGKTLFVGGGKSCQLTYRDYLTRLLAAMGLDMLPDDAFSDKEYATDWVDTDESQRLLRYQRHGFGDIAEAIAKSLGWKRRLVPVASPVVRAAMLRLSPYHGKRRS
jgi:nucleoside-diphosphate-sugar epimerase